MACAGGSSGYGPGMRLILQAGGFALPSARSLAYCQEVGDVLVEEFSIRRIAGSAGRVSPERRNRHQGDSGNERRLIPRVADGEVEIGLRGHVEKRNLDGAECALHVSVETRSGSYVVLLPGARLQNVIVGIGGKRRAESVHHLLESSAGPARSAP